MSAAEPLLAVEGLTVSYGGVVAVREVDLAVQPGTVVGLIGPNGAGKTSMIDALTGYHPAAAGRVRLDGQDITGLRAHKRARRGLTRTFQSIELFDDLSVEDNLNVARERVGIGRSLHELFLPTRRPTREDVEWALDLCGLTEVAHERPDRLPHGRRKLVGVARALASRPRLVLMDEPAAGLDTEESKVLGEHLGGLPAAGVTVLLVDHDMGLVLGVCEEVHVLDFGELIASGRPDEIRADEKVVTAYLGSQHGKDQLV